MTRWSLATMLAALAAGPWSGCDRDPVTPPATPPSERAPVDDASPADVGGIILLDAAHRRG